LSEALSPENSARPTPPITTKETNMRKVNDKDQKGIAAPDSDPGPYGGFARQNPPRKAPQTPGMGKPKHLTKDSDIVPDDTSSRSKPQLQFNGPPEHVKPAPVFTSGPRAHLKAAHNHRGGDSFGSAYAGHAGSKTKQRPNAHPAANPFGSPNAPEGFGDNIGSARQDLGGGKRRSTPTPKRTPSSIASAQSAADTDQSDFGDTGHMGGLS
jgi:hypothetical protein